MGEFAIKNVLPGRLNALVKKIMAQTGTNDPNEAVRFINSGEFKVVPAIEKKMFFTTRSGIEVYHYGDYFKFTLPATAGMTGAEWITYFKKERYSIDGYTESVLLSSNFKPTFGVKHEVIVLKSKIAHGINSSIRRVADELSLETPNAEIACLVRDHFTAHELRLMGMMYLVVMHEPINDSTDGPRLLNVNWDRDQESLDVSNGYPGFLFEKVDYGFAFSSSQNSVQG